MTHYESIGALAVVLLTLGGLALIFSDRRADLFGTLPVLLVLGENVLRGRREERAPAAA